MIKNFIPLIFLSLLFNLQACSKPQPVNTINKITHPAAQPAYAASSRTALDWDGVYRGKLPCADCEAIETSLTLRPDHTYIYKTRYIGLSEAVSVAQGQFSWSKDGQVIWLDKTQNPALAFFVGENRLWKLDEKGQRITGALAAHYQLKKVQSTAPETDHPALLFNRQWQLRYLDGLGNLEQSPIYIEFEQQEQRVFGFSGCNRFFGQFQINQIPNSPPIGFALQLSPLAMTKMACHADHHEGQFIQALQQVNQAKVSQNELELYNTKNRVIARFISAD